MNITINRRLVAAVLATTLAVTSCSAGDDTRVATGQGEDNTESSTDTAATRATDPDQTAGDQPNADEREETTTTEAPKASIDVAEAGFSIYEDYSGEKVATAGAIVKNDGKSTAEFIEVIFTFVDAAGKPVATETDYIYAIEASSVGHAGVEMVTIHGEPTKVEVAVVVEDDSFMGGSPIPVTVEAIAPEEYGDGVTVRGTAKNDTSEVIDYGDTSCILRSGGKIVGSASGYLDTMVPGASISWEASGPVPADAAECSAAFSS